MAGERKMMIRVRKKLVDVGVVFMWGMGSRGSKIDDQVEVGLRKSFS